MGNYHIATDSAHRPASPRPNPEQERCDVRVRLQYLKNDPVYETEKPLQITPNFLDREGKTNVRLAPGDEEIIHDVRGNESNFSLDANGFRYVRAPTAFTEWSSQPKIGRDYLPEVEEVLRREVDGCDEIIFYDARIRQAGEEGVRVEGLSFNPFARQVHTDNTERSIIAKVRHLTEMKADYLLGGRTRAINIWRPINRPVYDCGLAIADGGKLQSGDVMECDRRRHDTGEYWDTMGVIKYRKGFEWWYKSQQAPEDVLLFKNYDSATDVQARCCLHTAFDLPPEYIPPNAPTRESIEVRALVFTYPANQRPSINLKLPNTLAESLERSSLTRVDLSYSLNDYVREDIDEAREVKDAVLLLYRREIKQLQASQRFLELERDSLKEQISLMSGELQTAAEQITIQRDNETVLRAQVQSLYEQLKEKEFDNYVLSNTPNGTAFPGKDERTILLEQLARAKMETETWRREAIGRGNMVVSECFQKNVNDAVESERAKDAFVISRLRSEIAEIESQQCVKK